MFESLKYSLQTRKFCYFFLQKINIYLSHYSELPLPPRKKILTQLWQFYLFFFGGGGYYTLRRQESGTGVFNGSLRSKRSVRRMLHLYKNHKIAEYCIYFYAHFSEKTPVNYLIYLVLHKSNGFL